MTNKEIEEIKTACKKLYEVVSEISGSGAPAKSTLDKLTLAANLLRKIEKALPPLGTEKITPLPIQTDTPSKLKEFLDQPRKEKVYTQPWYPQIGTGTSTGTANWLYTPSTTIDQTHWTYTVDTSGIKNKP